ncbi:LysR family transcriptional regulator [Novosphingobium flavum]|uniref:LysR family transcriptional regulator n=1 Tax=Novosphingobium flavum TaxID=1778672 RepID=A0A7X1FTH4_9SPHN|nr:LysR family transcriptional regulator [Novosphingobium flavum]MBC2666651.1 LysR family transcriptional regulator [Novosphingobium flavum]
MIRAELGKAVSVLPSIGRLRAFRAAARCENICKAASELGRSQSAVSEAIQNMESESGFSLFNRTASGCYPTDAGKVLMARVDGFFAIMETAVAEALRASSLAGATPSTVMQRITWSDMLALRTLHEYGAFPHAARHCDVTVTSLRRSARRLERHLGVCLFENSAQGLKTNACGSKLAGQIILATRELECAEEEMKVQQRTLGGRLLIGQVSAGNFLNSLELDDFSKLHPEVKISVTSGSYDALLSKLRDGQIDLLIGMVGNPAPTPDVIEEVLGEDPYVIAASRNHALVRFERVSREDLASVEWIAPKSRRPIFERIFKGISSPRFNIETQSLVSIFVLLTRAKHLAILLRSELELSRSLGNHLVELNYAVERAPLQMGMSVRREWRPSAVQREFMNFLRGRQGGGSGFNGWRVAA